ncbi:MAG: hypothetical protein JXR76_10425 [Deltaproteobacteria bacterium]|nr:hypothetical protein [Deltaproteobacteria bacterium]
MHCTPTSTPKELKSLLNSVMHTRNGQLTILNQEILGDTIMEQLTCNCFKGQAAIARESQRAIWQICQYMGTPYTVCGPMVNCLTRDGVSDMIIPIVDANWIPFELLCIILSAGKEMEVGPLIFSVDKKDSCYRSIVCQILGAAVKMNWQAPVLFYDGESPLPLETVNLDWKKMLYFNSYELSHEPLESLMGKMLRSKFEDLSTEDWKRLADISPLHWSDLRDEIYYVYCDLFEELDMNETFPLLKRYVIPGWVKEDILDVI